MIDPAARSTTPLVPATPGQAVSRDGDLRMEELRVPGGGLVARFAPGAGMVGCSLRHDGVELLGILGDLDAYLDRGSVFGIPLLHPWANRIGGWSYAVAGRTVRLDRDSPLLHGDAHCLPIHGAVAAGSDWQVTRRAPTSTRHGSRPSSTGPRTRTCRDLPVRPSCLDGDHPAPRRRADREHRLRDG